MRAFFGQLTRDRTILKACTLLGIQIAITEVVLDEVKGNYPKTLTEKVASYRKAHKDLAKIIDLPQHDILEDAAAQEFAAWLDGFVADHGFTVIPYPAVTPKQLVLQSYANVKPFKPSGEGHKDYMIWESIKGYVNGNVSPPLFYLLTNNPKDFCQEQENKKQALHPDLAKQIEVAEFVPDIFLSLGAFFDAVVAPLLEGVTIDQIPNLSFDEIDSMTTEKLEEELYNYTAYGFEGVPFTNEVTATVVGSITVEDRELKKIDDELVIIVSGTVPIEVDGYMEKHTYYSEDDLDDIFISDRDWNDHVMAVSKTVDTQFELKLFYSPDNQTVVGHSLTLPQEISDGYPYK